MKIFLWTELFENNRTRVWYLETHSVRVCILSSSSNQYLRSCSQHTDWSSACVKPKYAFSLLQLWVFFASALVELHDLCSSAFFRIGLLFRVVICRRTGDLSDIRTAKFAYVLVQISLLVAAQSGRRDGWTSCVVGRLSELFRTRCIVSALTPHLLQEDTSTFTGIKPMYNMRYNRSYT